MSHSPKSSAPRPRALSRVERSEPTDALTQYHRELDARERMGREEEDRLGALAVAGDLDARNQLAEGNLKLVPRVVRKFHRDGVAFEDLIQAGNIGLLRAAEKWDPAMRVPFGAYAPDWIERYAREVVARDGYATRIPLYRQEMFVTIQKMRITLEQRLGREATPAEIAEAANRQSLENLAAKTQRKHGRSPTDEEVREVCVTAREVEEAVAFQTWGVSLDAPPSGDEQEGTFGERLPDTEAVDAHTRAERREMRDLIDEALDRLEERERLILIHYMGLRGHPERTLEQIGEFMGLTRERVRQLKEKGLRDLERDPALIALAAA